MIVRDRNRVIVPMSGALQQSSAGESREMMSSVKKLPVSSIRQMNKSSGVSVLASHIALSGDCS